MPGCPKMTSFTRKDWSAENIKHFLSVTALAWMQITLCAAPALHAAKETAKIAFAPRTAARQRNSHNLLAKSTNFLTKSIS